MVGVLRLAMDHDCEERLGHELLATVEQHQPLPSLKALQARYLVQHPAPSIPARQHEQSNAKPIARHDRLPDVSILQGR